jgi:glucose/arabinose dehydrogenase
MKAHKLSPRTCLLTTALLLSACSAHAGGPVEHGMGPNPNLPEPDSSLVPTVNIASVIGWKGDEKPVGADGFQVTKFADGLDHPRWLYVLPNGDVLVAETNAPPKPEDGQGIKGWVVGQFMKKAGAKTPSANRIMLFRDKDGDGTPDERHIFLQDLHSPFGMALAENDFYVANTDAVMRFPYRAGETSINAAGEKLTDLPGGPLNHHWTKNLVVSPDGSKLYASVGSNSNIGENGMDKEEGRAAIWEIDRVTGKKRIFASGLRNPVGMDWQPDSHALWTSVNERDELGNDLVPDYMTSVTDGAFYGWPYSYFGQNIDERVDPPRPDLVAKAIKPDYALGSHTASLGLTFYDASLFPDQYHGGAFIGQHGSWNREPPSGYKVIFVPFDKNGNPEGMPRDFLTGFLNEEGDAHGRPVGVIVDKQGALLVADDVGNVIWRVTPKN